MSDTPSIPTTDAIPGMPWQERLDRANFGLGFLLAAATKKPMTSEEAADIATHCAAVKNMLAEAQDLYDDAQDAHTLCDRLSDLLTHTADVLKGPPGPLSRHSWHDLPESAALAMAPDMHAIRHAAAPFDLWWCMMQAQEEMCERPIADEAVVFHFMGSGASHMVTAKQLRTMMAAIYGPPIPNATAGEPA